MSIVDMYTVIEVVVDYSDYTVLHGKRVDFEIF